MTYFGRQAIASLCIFLLVISSCTVNSSSTMGAKGRFRMYGAGGKRTIFTDLNESDKDTDFQVVADLRLMLEDVKAYSDVLLNRLEQVRQLESPRTDYKKWQLN